MRSILLALCLSACVHAQQLVLPPKCDIGQKLAAELKYEAPEGSFLSTLWSIPDGLEYEQVKDTVFLWCKTPGRYKVEVIAIPQRTITIEGQTFSVLTGEIRRFDGTVTFAGGVPPSPVDPPGPIDPPVVVDPPPFPSNGLAVMILREVEDNAKMSASQLQILTSPRMLQWAKQNCVAEQGRILWANWSDDYTDAEISNTPPTLRNAYRDVLAASKGQLPWMAVSNGKAGWQGPLPQTVDDVISICERFK